MSIHFNVSTTIGGFFKNMNIYATMYNLHEFLKKASDGGCNVETS